MDHYLIADFFVHDRRSNINAFLELVMPRDCIYTRVSILQNIFIIQIFGHRYRGLFSEVLAAFSEIGLGHYFETDS